MNQKLHKKQSSRPLIKLDCSPFKISTTNQPHLRCKRLRNQPIRVSIGVMAVYQKNPLITTHLRNQCWNICFSHHGFQDAVIDQVQGQPNFFKTQILLCLIRFNVVIERNFNKIGIKQNQIVIFSQTGDGTGGSVPIFFLIESEIVAD